MRLNDLCSIRKRFRILRFKIRNRHKEKFECPVCGYQGPFMDLVLPFGLRRHAQCPYCNSLERQRMQFVVLRDKLGDWDTTRLKMLHFAPEPMLREYFSRRFGRYESADLNMKDVDHKVDLQLLPFADESYDFVFASHVLEHVPRDDKALSEIRRILKPKGIAVLPVPIVAGKTVEYPKPNPLEHDHVRAPGMDYFSRYERYFSRVVVFRSDDLPRKYQLFIYENRSMFPSIECPLRPGMAGEKHEDHVPVCYA